MGKRNNNTIIRFTKVGKNNNKVGPWGKGIKGVGVPPTTMSQ